MQSILGLGSYAVPAVRSFLMASAIVPVVSAAITTTVAPTTTRSAWRPLTGRMDSLLQTQPGGGSNPVLNRGGEGSGSLLPPSSRRPGLKKP
ncbi:MAG TPA: hypothetical protein VKU19_20965 [Bryobacteraceae bacterium]|nr:hypothetical protein [Bryobacteraceae bacterium]